MLYLHKVTQFCKLYVRPMHSCENHTQICMSNHGGMGKLKLLLYLTFLNCESEGYTLTQGLLLENLQVFLSDSSLRASGAYVARKAEGTMAHGSFFLASTWWAPKQAARPLPKCLILSLTCKLMSHFIKYTMASHRPEAQQRVERTGVCCGLWSTDPSNRVWGPLNLESPFPGRIFKRLCR